MKGKKYLILWTLILMNVVEQPAPEISLSQGVLIGRISGDGTVHEYIGIPYAVTTRETRFQAPLPAPSWTGIFRAVEEYSCPQKEFLLPSSDSEDCLKINVYIPAAAAKPLPVMVFIHGGAFVMGSGGNMIYSPNLLVKRGVILVTFNYRLGALGFLCLNIKEAPGNAGLKDQVAALRWVKKNIAAFGGDPDNITIFGESAGASSTSLLIATNVTDGLFKRAIVQSGSGVSNWAINKKPLWIASLLAKSLGFDSEDPYILYDFFLKTKTADFVYANVTKPWQKYFDSELVYLPCVEKSFPGLESVITDLPYNLFKSASRKNVSVIYGSNDKEGLFLIAYETEERLLKRNDGYMFASDLQFSSDEEADNVSKVVNEFYFGKDLISSKKVFNVSDIYTHLYFEMPIIFESEILLESSDQPIYNYMFRYSGGRNFMKYISGYSNETGSCHGDELFYLFDGWIWPFRINKSDHIMINWMTELWTNFAKYGDPTPKHRNNLSIQWAPSKKDDLKFLIIDKELKMESIPNRKAYDLWKGVYKNHRKLKL